MIAHGGDVKGFAARYGRQPLDFSANVSPLGLPAGVRRAIIASLDGADRYPDPLCRDLRAKIAEKQGVPASAVVCGNGAADLIFRVTLAEKPKRALILAPTFSEYACALAASGCEVVRHHLRPEDGYRLTERTLDQLTPGVDMAFLCNPNNPTGLLTDLALMDKIAARCEEAGIRLVVDECFLGFVDGWEKLTLRARLREFPRVFVLDAFTKLYGMAGVRLGYGVCADEAMLSRVRAAGQPWAVSSLAEAAGIAALDEEDTVRDVRALIAKEKPRLSLALKSRGMTVWDGAANFLFFRAPSADLRERMAERGVLIRSCANYEGLDARYFRVAVRTAPENDALIAALDA